MQLGIELANSAAFAQCQVDKVFKAICLRDPNVFADDRSARDQVRDRRDANRLSAAPTTCVKSSSTSLRTAKGTET